MTEKEQIQIEVELDDKLIMKLKAEAKLVDMSFNEFLTYIAKLGLQVYTEKSE